MLSLVTVCVVLQIVCLAGMLIFRRRPHPLSWLAIAEGFAGVCSGIFLALANTPPLIWMPLATLNIVLLGLGIRLYRRSKSTFDQ